MKNAGDSYRPLTTEHGTPAMNWLEVSLTVNGELAEAVADVLARYAPNGVTTEQGVKFLSDEDEGTAAGPITVRANPALTGAGVHTYCRSELDGGM